MLKFNNSRDQEGELESNVEEHRESYHLRPRKSIFYGSSSEDDDDYVLQGSSTSRTITSSNELDLATARKRILGLKEYDEHVHELVYEISDAMLNVELSEDHYIASGILFHKDLMNNNKGLYERLKTKKLSKLLKPPKLEIEKLDSIQEHFVIALMNNIDTQIPMATNLKYYYELVSFLLSIHNIWNSINYQEKMKVSEKTWRNDMISSTIRFLSINSGKNVVKLSDGSASESTKDRNNQSGGPLRFPDYMWLFYNKEKQYSYEFLFVEVSYGPHAGGAYLSQHIKEDRSRLAKMAKEGWNSILNFIKEYGDEDCVKILNELEIITIHVYRKKLVVYSTNRAYKPFFNNIINQRNPDIPHTPVESSPLDILLNMTFPTLKTPSLPI
nr:10749_t:CDS:2 [Entrophospora candida]